MPTTATIAPVDGLAILNSLPLKIRNFCREYIIDFNGLQAVIRAGYSRKGASSQAVRLLANASVQASVCALTKQKADKLDLTAERTMTEAARVGYSDIRKLFHPDGKPKKPHELDDATAAAVESYNWKKGEYTCHPKNPALTLCARIAKIIDSDQVPALPPGSYMIMVPATSQEDQWLKLAAVQAKRPVKMIESSNGTPHARNGDGA